MTSTLILGSIHSNVINYEESFLLVTDIKVAQLNAGYVEHLAIYLPTNNNQYNEFEMYQTCDFYSPNLVSIAEGRNPITYAKYQSIISGRFSRIQTEFQFTSLKESLR